MVPSLENYVRGTNDIIDEQLLAFRGQRTIRMYNSNKPAKHGVKLEVMRWWFKV